MSWVANLREWFSSATGHVETERRVCPRYKVALTVEVTAGKKTYRGRTRDTSLSGMGVYLQAELELGERVELTYELGDGSPVKKVFAVVRNREEHRYGLEFVE
jgi:c-di-GMP-binding flagellar brake protein YcgR